MTKHVRRIARTLNDAGFICMIAGGFVRDKVMNMPIKDIDLVTDATPDQIEALFKNTIPIGKSFGVITVVFGTEQFEVATLRNDSIGSDGRRPESVEFTNSLIEDARRRDFTMNAMFMDVFTGEILDPFNGREAIAEKILRPVGNIRQRFQEDHLRMLRAIRFAVTHDLTIPFSDLMVIREMSSLIQKISAERIQKELVKILASPDPERGIELMLASGILDKILPEVAMLENVEQPAMFHPEGDVLRHTLIALGSAKNATPIGRLAILLHDIGKPICQTFNPEKQRIQFIGHETVGAQMAEEIMRRLKFSKVEIGEVVFAVRNHMKMHTIAKMRRCKQLALVNHRFFGALRSVAVADVCGTFSDPTELITLIEELESIEVADPLINGSDLIEAGFPEGPAIGKILNKVREHQIEGRVKTREQALKTARGIT